MALYAVPSTESALLLRDAAETISISVYIGETLTNATGNVTIGIVDATGATVIAAGTATSTSATGVYEYTVPAQSNLKELTATWSGTWSGAASLLTTQHEVVGGFYTTPSEIRAMNMIEGESATYTLSDLVNSISYATEVIDSYVGVPFVYRYHRDVLDGTNHQDLKLTKMFPQVILAGSIGGTALTATQISNLNKYKSGVIRLKDDVWAFNNPPPPDISWCARTVARFWLLEMNSRIPDQATSISSEFGNIQISQPGQNRPTGIQSVDTILNRYRQRAPSAF
jgi:hypothetical protein